MAQLKIEGGPFSYTKTANNTRAQTVYTGAALRLGYSGDPSDLQAVLDFIGARTVEWWVGLDHAYRRDQKSTEATRTEFES